MSNENARLQLPLAVVQDCNGFDRLPVCHFKILQFISGRIAAIYCAFSLFLPYAHRVCAIPFETDNKLTPEISYSCNS